MIYILLATYNGEKYFSEQIESLLSQTYQDWKLWIHDDGSKDNTVQIIRNYANQYPEKIVFLDDTISCGGAKENFSYLLNNIDKDFDYIMFCDQDDVWLPNRIELFLNEVEIQEKNNPNLPLVIFSDLIVVDDKLNVISNSMVKHQKLNPNIANSFELLKCQNVITGCAMLLNKKAFEVSTPISKNVLMHDWWIALIVSKLGKNIYLDEKTILYRQHSNNVVGSKKVSLLTILKKVFSMNIFNNYKDLKLMLLECDYKLNFFKFIICKIVVITIRFLRK